ncbi:MAG: RNA polymerase sigma factor [Methylococcaceae bacterium]|jgi:RNA polymerase sigma factor (sigma-70 family)
MADKSLINLEKEVSEARKGNRVALETIVRAVQKDIYNLAIRFLWSPQDAEDATQEILIKIITGLDGFRSESSFRTWVYRVACNTLLTLSKKRMEQQGFTFEAFGNDLADGLSDELPNLEDEVEMALLIEEVKIGCTLAMLMCLNREQRMAYILGEILDLDQYEAAEILAISTDSFRKRLSRAKQAIMAFMLGHCGLVESANPCRCNSRLGTAIKLGRVQPKRLNFAVSLVQAKGFPEVLAMIRQLEDTRRIAQLYRSHPQPEPSDAFIAWLRALLDEMPSLKDQQVVSLH